MEIMELKEIIQKIEELKSEIDSYRPIPTDALNRYMQKIKLDWNYHSNSIEGNSLTMSETKSLILYGITAKGKPMRDHLEVKGHNDALKKLEDVVHKDLKITESLIKAFHKLILAEPFNEDGVEINPGEYKKFPNYLYTSTGERIDFEPPSEVPRLMNELINWLNNHLTPPKRKKNKYELHPLLIACGFHSQFIKIHPFGDGNGRMARIMMNLILMQAGYVPTIIKLEDRDTYYNQLNQSSIENVEPLAEFIGNETIKSLELFLKSIKGESIEDPDDLDKEIEIIKRSLIGVNKIVTKSPEVIRQTIINVYLKYLGYVNNEMKRFDSLFEIAYWAEKDPNNNFAPLVENFLEKELDVIFKNIKNNANNKKDFSYEVYYQLIRFNSEDKSFDVSVINTISFYERNYTVECIVGSPHETSEVSLNLRKLFNNENKLESEMHLIEKEIAKINYNREVFDDEIASWAKTTAKYLIGHIKYESMELQKRRDNENDEIDISTL